MECADRRAIADLLCRMLGSQRAGRSRDCDGANREWQQRSRACFRSRSSIGGPTTTTTGGDHLLRERRAPARPAGPPTTSYPAPNPATRTSRWPRQPVAHRLEDRDRTTARQMVLKDGSPGNYSAGGRTKSTCRTVRVRMITSGISRTATSGDWNRDCRRDRAGCQLGDMGA